MECIQLLSKDIGRMYYYQNQFESDIKFRPWTPRYSFARIVGRESSLDVPASIHFLWLGKVIPNKYLKNLETFRSTNYDVSELFYLNTVISQAFSL